jgi:hypothetical protein
MTTQQFLIGPIKDGVTKNTRPWATPEDSFEELLNSYQFRGRIVKRPGYTLLGNLDNGTPVMGLKTREQFGINIQSLVAFDLTTSYEWNGTAFIPLVFSGTLTTALWNGADHDFFYTANYANAFWATNGKEGLHGWNLSSPGTFTASAGVGNLATVNVLSAGNGVQVGDQVYFINLDAAVQNNAAILAVVTVAGNPFTVRATGLKASSTFTWTNGDSAKGMVLDASRNITGQDGIRYYGVLTNGTGWANYNPPVDITNVLAGALLIFPYRGYLVFLSTIEGNDQGTDPYTNRARWTQIGTPYYSEPVPSFPNLQGVDINAARDDLFGRGGATDAPTNEAIVAAAFIRDILVVYFTRSTWRLRFVNNAQNPFVWERVNVELGSDCTGSAIPFDKGLMAIGNRGIVISDGNDTQRFDEKIPDEIFQIRATNFGFQRVQGIRTFETKLNYWTFPDKENPDGTFPDKVLVFNYETKTWAFFDDCFTCFGYFYPSSSGETWAELTQPWSSYGTTAWNSGVSASGFETIVAGNQQGYVFKLEQTSGVNVPSLTIANITAANPGVFTVTNNNLPDGTWIKLSGIIGITSDDGVSLNGRNFKISKVLTTDNDFTISEFEVIDGGLATGLTYTTSIGYVPIIPGSVQINVGALVFKDTDLDGALFEASALGQGQINYTTGAIILNFNPAIAASPVAIRVVSYADDQGLAIVATTGVYTPDSGELTKISNIGIQTKFFNFFGNAQRARLNKIDFYMDVTNAGQLTCDVLADSSDVPVNTPLSDNPQSNVILTTINPYQVGGGPETIYRFYCEAQAQTLQLSLYLTDEQMAVDSISQSDFELLSMNMYVRPGGRLV